MVLVLTADGWKLVTAGAVGPASDVSVAAGATANIDLAVSANPASIKELIALATVAGLPTGLAIAGISFIGTSTVRIVVFNPTASAVTVTANSVTATVLASAA
jgi:hypothetical protein